MTPDVFLKLDLEYHPGWSRAPQRSNLLGSQKSLRMWEWEGVSSAVNIRLLKDPGTPLSGPLFSFLELSVRGLQPPGLWAAWWGGSMAGSSGQPAKQQEAQLGKTAWEQDREGGSEHGRGVEWDLGLAPLGQNPLPAQHLWWSLGALKGTEQGQQPGLAKGRLHVRGSCRKLLESSCLVWEVIRRCCF